MISSTARFPAAIIEARHHVIHAPTGRRLTLHVTRVGRHRRFALRNGTRLRRLKRWIYEDAEGARYAAVTTKAP